MSNILLRLKPEDIQMIIDYKNDSAGTYTTLKHVLEKCKNSFSVDLSAPDLSRILLPRSIMKLLVYYIINIINNLYCPCGRTINNPPWEDTTLEPSTSSLGLPSTSMHTQSQEGGM